MDVAVSRGLSGGHAEDIGLSETGAPIGITPHRHDVELNLTRFEIGLSRNFNDTWDAALRVPYFIKEQTASVAFPSGGTAEEREAARRNGDIHHRTETYEGIGDPELTIGWRKRDLLGENSVFRFSLGLTLPFGETEEDPWLLGDAGLKHLHQQFGNGTFDPIADLYLGKPINDDWGWSVYAKARLPLYKNKYGYRGAPELLLAPRLTYLVNRKLSISAGAAAQYFGYSEWDSGRDRNSGQFSVNASASLGYKVSEQVTGSLTVLLPLYNKSLASSEDALDPAPTFSLSLGYSF
ncbi:MAG: hypothetical protein ACI8T1_001455 [Verrucomicrobiales bacterium]